MAVAIRLGQAENRAEVFVIIKRRRAEGIKTQAHERRVRMAQEGTSTLGSVEKAFTILDHVSITDSVGVTELARHTGLHKSTVHAYLRTLDSLGYVTNEDGRYHASLKLFNRGAGVRNRLPVYAKGRDALRDLAEETGELANIGVLDKDRVAVVLIAEGADAILDRSKPGTRMPIHSSALGKAILAHLPRDEVRRMVERTGMPQATERTITDIDDLCADLDRIRDRGYATDDEEGHSGIFCVAAPVVVADDPLGAVSVTGPSQRMQEDARLESVVDAVVNAANIVEVKIEYEQE